MFQWSADTDDSADADQNLLRKVHNDLALDSVNPSAPHARLAIFAAGFLTLCLAGFSGVFQSICLYT